MKHTLLATPMELYNRPANLFVAGFIGSPAIKGVRSEDMLVQADAIANSLAAKVTLMEPTGAKSYVLVDGASGEFNLRSAGEATYAPGAPLHLGFAADKVHVFDAAGGLRLN